jgi:hypothetical protein
VTSAQGIRSSLRCWKPWLEVVDFWEVIVIVKTRLRDLRESIDLGPEECGGRPNWARDTGRARVNGADGLPCGE